MEMCKSLIYNFLHPKPRLICICNNFRWTGEEDKENDKKLTLGELLNCVGASLHARCSDIV